MADQLNIILAVQTAEANRKLNQTAKAVDGVTDSVNRAGNKAKQFGNQFNKNVVFLNKFGKGVAQQAGYQIADFAVQVGNGTSAIQAFGQQGSQMLAIFGPVGSLIGAGVAVFSALATVAYKSGESFLGFNEAAKSTEQASNDLNQALSNLSRTYRTDVKSSVEQAKQVFGDLSPAMKEILELSREVAKQKAFKQLSEQLKSFMGADVIKEAARSLLSYNLAVKQSRATGDIPFNPKMFSQAQNSFNKLSEAAKKQGKDLEATVKGFKQAKDILSSFTKETDFSSKKLKEYAEKLVPIAKGLDGEVKVQLSNFIDLLTKASTEIENFEGKSSIERIKKAFSESTKSLQNQNQELAVQNELFGQVESVKVREIQLLQLYKQIQSGVVELDKDQIKARLTAISQQFQQNQLAEQLKKNAEDAAKASSERQKKEKEAAEQAAKIAKEQTEKINKQITNFNKLLQSIDKQTEQARLKNELFGQSNDLIEAELMFRQEIEKLTKDGNKLTLEEINIVRARIDELFREKQILTEKKETLKAQQELQKKIAKEREEANKRAEEEQKRINELMADGFRTVSDAISGLINKTTSWRDALGAVLKKVIDIASKMGTTKSGGFSFNKLFGMGAKLLPSLFGAPTTPFGTSTGPMFPGLMDFHTGGIVGGKPQKGMRSDERMIVARTGERVLNRGQAMMAEQGGTGGGVVVNQTINISTGVQQTVRAEIMSMAPQIAAQAKSAVLDARRRGGGFSAAFA